MASIEHNLEKIIQSMLNIDSREILDWVTDSYLPEEVFSDDALGRWAVENGYKPEE